MQSEPHGATDKRQAVGSFCLVLHGHMPYVLHHGTWPHGEDWLYEAVAECYLPLLALIHECEHLGCNPQFAIGLTPVLLEQLAHADFASGFEKYLKDRVSQARADRYEFERQGQAPMAHLAERWEGFFTGLAVQFDRISRNLPKAFAEQMDRGLIQILTSSATHAYLPLLLEDSCVRAQIRAGLSSSERILGIRPQGMWLPEGAYRPAGPWSAPIPWGPQTHRLGIDQALTDERLSHFFVENHLLRGPGVRDSARDPDAAGGPVVRDPVWIQNNGRPGQGLIAFARDPEICKQVWCGFVGYPADGVYLEFHKRHGPRRGLRYWRVTDRHSDLGDKQPYAPDEVAGKVYEQATHFCAEVKRRLVEYHQRTGRRGAVVACFDAELFGHWWFEGPQFLRDVLLTLNADPAVELRTPEAHLKNAPPDRSMSLSEGSWGEGGDHRVWAHPKVHWMWRIEYRCETLFGKLTYHLPWRRQVALRQILEKAGRELLLLQASDWPFVISRSQADEYGMKRFLAHVSRFECLTDLAESLGADPTALDTLSEAQRSELHDADVHDVIFPQVNLNWWNMQGFPQGAGAL